MIYANQPIQFIEHELRVRTASLSSHIDYDELIEQYARSVQLGVQSMISASTYIKRACSQSIFGGLI